MSSSTSNALSCTARTLRKELRSRRRLGETKKSSQLKEVLEQPKVTLFLQVLRGVVAVMRVTGNTIVDVANGVLDTAGKVHGAAVSVMEGAQTGTD